MINIQPLHKHDKKVISQWQYEGEHAGFNYAMGENGWINSYCIKENSLCFVAKETDAIIGMFLFIAENSYEFRILINPDFLNKGFGKSVTKKALELGFNTLKFKEISLIVRKQHTIAISLYQKMGFTITGETEEKVNNQPMEFYKMVKLNETDCA